MLVEVRGSAISGIYYLYEIEICNVALEAAAHLV